MFRPPTDTDLYAVLGVAASAPHDVVQSAYRRLMRQTHPDIAGNDPVAVDTAVQANLAWSVLRDPRRRADYDRARAAVRAAPGRQSPGSPPRVPEPSWGAGGIRPITAQQLREAAARESAYSEAGRQQRLAFSQASLRVGTTVLLVGAILLLLAVSAGL